MSRDTFAKAAESAARLKLEEIKHLSFEDALKQPAAAIEDVVVAGKEVQLAVFRQSGIPDLPEAVLITAQITRAGLGGVINYRHEQGWIFFPSGGNRDATETELLATSV